MNYYNWCSRSHPGHIYIIVDKNAYMKNVSAEGNTYAEIVSDFVNRFMGELGLQCSQGSSISRSVKVTIVEYGDNGVHIPHDGWIDTLFNDDNLPYYEVIEKYPDGVGGFFDVDHSLRRFVNSITYGITSPVDAFRRVYALLLTNKLLINKEQEREMPVPIIIHTTNENGIIQDINDIANKIANIHYSDGNPIIFNCIFTSHINEELVCPSESQLALQCDTRIFGNILSASSIMPETYRNACCYGGYYLENNARCLLINPHVHHSGLFFMQFGGSEPYIFRNR